MQKVVRKVLRAVADYDPAYYDMHDDPNEAFFARIYVARIRAQLADAGIVPPATVLEAGCQAGRLVLPFAQMGFRVTGIDTSGFALRRAKRHVRAAGADAELLQGDLVEVLQRRPERQYDVVICAEVLYLWPGYRAMLETLAGAVRPGGLLCVSHRPRFYYLLEALRHRDLATARRVLSSSGGQFEGPFPEKGYYNWQDEPALRALYGALGLRCRALYPIDRYAWLAGVSPSQLDPAAQEAWLQLELEGQEPSAACGRYVLVIAEKPKA